MESPPSMGNPGRTGFRHSGDEHRAKRRRGRNVDVIASPAYYNPLPTPETVRRPHKSKPASQPAHPPTPQTQRHIRRAPSPNLAADSHHTSPSNQATSDPSTYQTATRPEKTSRRRPGLMFAQQMGLVDSRGVGVGMGGHRLGHAKGALKAVKEEENPFLVSSDAPPAKGASLGAAMGLASPGAIQPHSDDEDSHSDVDDEPAPSRLSLQSPATGLLSPPPTKHAPRISDPSSQTVRTRAEQASSSKHALQSIPLDMLDPEHNPFLEGPSEPARRRPGPSVDEDQATITYIFRGAKRVFANPLYPSAAPFPQADLLPEDEEYEPHPLPKPRLLWPEGPKDSSKRINVQEIRRRGARTPSPGPSSRLRSHSTSASLLTPTTSKARRFANVTRDSPNFGGGSSAFTDEELEQDAEGEEEESDDDDEPFKPLKSAGAKLAELGKRGEEEEEELPVRRGLLFGAGAGMKRDREGGEEGRVKRMKGAERL
ncbi:hypothetical protein L202_00800 [Cryptococcus amylolentus CBS 6039]|uniref:Uncharacterized protein n=1 Tax=Cryptococcus amylolentus CBS 6039 TaxID=1295533 RepID=A0A1E3IAM8_9TREE|nr:hypothetical protein L202_00800 [Cryptococcus amylolentus CBS 6039]ODN84956.1 hypothetical protein L202_00800 [Cryptococcus amylolentus CBS 6039]